MSAFRHIRFIGHKRHNGHKRYEYFVPFVANLTSWYRVRELVTAAVWVAANF
ncbi:MAG: hypothetical protein RLN82_00415 [Pseudomonadales bacterium]